MSESPPHDWATLVGSGRGRFGIRYGCRRCGQSGTVRDVERRFKTCYPNPAKAAMLDFQARKGTIP